MIINVNALYKELKKKSQGIPYVRVASAVSGIPSGLPEKVKQQIIAIIRKSVAEVEGKILKS